MTFTEWPRDSVLQQASTPTTSDVQRVAHRMRGPLEAAVEIAQRNRAAERRLSEKLGNLSETELVSAVGSSEATALHLARALAQGAYEHRFGNLQAGVRAAMLAVECGKESVAQQGDVASVDALAMAEATLANALRIQGDFGRSGRHLDAALDVVQEGSGSPHVLFFIHHARLSLADDSSAPREQILRELRALRSTARLSADKTLLAVAEMDAVPIEATSGEEYVQRYKAVLHEHGANLSPLNRSIVHINTAASLLLRCSELDIPAVQHHLDSCRPEDLETSTLGLMAQCVRASCCAHRGEFAKAQVMFREALETAAALANPGRFLRVLEFISRVLLVQGRWSEARLLAQAIQAAAVRLGARLPSPELLEIWLAAVAAERMDQATHDKLLSITVRDPSRL